MEKFFVYFVLFVVKMARGESLFAGRTLHQEADYSFWCQSGRR